jgi:electron transport complex protein RnfB
MSKEDLDIFRKLQQHLDKMPVGFPATESGIELKVLKHLFTPEEADLAINLNFMPDPLKKVFRRVKRSDISIEELEKKLDQMYNKGLIHYGKSGDEKFYANAPLVIGMFEFQLKRLSKEFIIDIKQYFEEAFFEKEFNITGIPQLRTIPIEQSIPHEQNIATYDDLRHIIDTCEGAIAVAECICRKGKDLMGDPCKKTDLREICFSFRGGAEMYHDKGMARLVSKEEALEILGKVEEAGLVLQPGNSQRPMCICCCCGCCCEVLTNQKRFDEPAKLFATNFYAKVDPNLCIGCGVCEERCNMDAIELIDEKSKINIARCIGCGVCVPTCPQDAISLKKKKKETVPPINTAATYMNIMDKKAELARMEKT